MEVDLQPVAVHHLVFAVPTVQGLCFKHVLCDIIYFFIEFVLYMN
jgi:hypothetical protein